MLTDNHIKHGRPYPEARIGAVGEQELLSKEISLFPLMFISKNTVWIFCKLPPGLPYQSV